jgi:TonB-dependent receptor
MNSVVQKFKTTASQQGRGAFMCLLTCAVMALSARAQETMQQKTTIAFNGQSLVACLDQITTATGVRFYYEGNELRQVAKKYTATYTNEPLAVVLKALLEGTGFAWQEVNHKVVIKKTIAATSNRPAVLYGRVTGMVIDGENGQPVIGVSVCINNKGTITDIDGSFSLSLPQGSYTAMVRAVGYSTKEVTGVEVKDKQPFALHVTLKREKGNLAGVVVTAAAKKESVVALYARQKNNAAMSDGISAEQISRTPDNNTAQVLKRVSGLQISQDKYVVVRGLSDRYNNVLLNGYQLPSSEPNRRDFAFDMIPSGLVDHIVVNKTAVPDLPGEFTGGLVQVTTKDIPDANFTTVSIGTGFNSQATGKDFIGGQRQTANYFGFVNSYEKKPEGMSFKEYDVLAAKINDGVATTAEKQQAARFLGQFPDNWAMRRYTARPIQNYAVSAGRSIPVSKGRLGVIAALTYRNEQTADLDEQYVPTVQDYKGTDYVFTTLIGGSLNLGYAFGRNKFTVKNTYNRRFTDKLYQYKSVDIINGSALLNNYAAQTLMNELFQTSFTGEHAFGKRGVRLDYGAALSTLERDQPNSRIMNMRGSPASAGDPENYYQYNFNDYQPDYGSVFYSNLKEKRYSYQANLLVPFTLLKLQQSFKLGYQGSYRKADYSSYSYRIRNVPGADNNFNGFAYTDVYNNQNFIDQKLFFISYIGAGQAANTGLPVGYAGSQRLNAWYGMLDIRPLEKLRLIGGLRTEQNNQEVFTNTLGRVVDPNQVRPMVDSLISVKKTDWLPSVNAIYALTPKMNIRAAYYTTVARPDLRELSYFEYFDFDVFRTISGSDLKPTQIKNYDLRFEFYPGTDEIISVSGFYKSFTNPIELTFVPTSAKPFLIYRNLPGAKDLGFEVDVRKSLRFFSPASAFLKRLYVSGSFTWVDASVDLGSGVAVDDQGKPVASKRDRPLYGQSPYIINGGINYTGSRLGINAVYNRYGKRVVTSTAYTSEDEYENPRDVIDVQLSYKFLKSQRAELRLNISDLLNQPFLTYKNQYGPNHSVYKERDPSVERYPGDGSAALPPDQLDPKGTSYNASYDVVTRRRKSGTNYTLNFIYRF